MSFTFLMIGGSRDKEYITVENPRPHLTLVKRQPPLIPAPFSLEPVIREYDLEEYTLHSVFSLNEPARVVQVYGLSTLSGQEVANRTMRYYQDRCDHTEIRNDTLQCRSCGLSAREIIHRRHAEGI